MRRPRRFGAYFLEALAAPFPELRRSRIQDATLSGELPLESAAEEHRGGRCRRAEEGQAHHQLAHRAVLRHPAARGAGDRGDLAPDPEIRRSFGESATCALLLLTSAVAS